MQNTDSKDIKILAGEEKRKYFKEWRKRNKEKVKAYNQNFWEKQALKNLESDKKGQI